MSSGGAKSAAAKKAKTAAAKDGLVAVDPKLAHVRRITDWFFACVEK